MTLHIEPTTEAEWERYHRRRSREAAKAFVRACTQSDADELKAAADFCNDTDHGWRYSMLRVAGLPSVERKIKAAFLDIWIEQKNLRDRVGDRKALAGALYVLMACPYQGGPLRLYRGASGAERRAGAYGFSWSSDEARARLFAEDCR